MDIVKEFVDRYVREYDYYEASSRIAAGLLKADLDAAGIRAIVTHRPKAVDRVERKCRRRHNAHPYGSVEDIVADIVDLAGVRVALYFPGERDEVDKAIRKLFTIDHRKDHPGTPENQPQSAEAQNESASTYNADSKTETYQRRFPGYTARHYRVRMNEPGLTAAESRYAAARIEIQVASVLMHAWSEVEHDLVYKPLDEGVQLSEDETALIDQLNGLVHSGEIALERLQKAADRRISEKDRRFRNHYELAAHLIAEFQRANNQPVNTDGLGRVDELFEYLNAIRMDNPAALAPAVQSLHENLETRSLSEQVIDATLAEDGSRYDILMDLGRRAATARPDSDWRELHASIGQFVMEWSQLEQIIRDRVEPDLRRRPLARVLRDSALAATLGESRINQIEWLRQARNSIVHPQRDFVLSPNQLLAAIEETRSLANSLRASSDGLSHDG
ncbi:RelA/SpoT domain-containing protein [Nocardia sp. NPDC047038]|uniref:RelA/SpoT domain-containing protein n=1 Tax=Nocardia sp. NPDC047038 TaxID=3154338 RepID=UPI0033E4DB53